MERNLWNASSTKSDTMQLSGEPVKQIDKQKISVTEELVQADFHQCSSKG